MPERKLHLKSENLKRASEEQMPCHNKKKKTTCEQRFYLESVLFLQMFQIPRSDVDFDGVLTYLKLNSEPSHRAKTALWVHPVNICCVTLHQ